jgi:hypothetical protein
MQGTLLTSKEAEVRDLALDIVNEGHTATAAAEMALTVLPARDLDPKFVDWISGGALRVGVGNRVARVR